MKTSPASCLLVAAGLALAAGTAAAQPIAYATVAEALKALEARDGNGTIVTHADGWVVVNEPLASAQWSFTPQGHAAYPAVVKRVIRRQPGGQVSVDTQVLCEAPEAACTQLRADFDALNERIIQARRGRAAASP